MYGLEQDLTRNRFPWRSTASVTLAANACVRSPSLSELYGGVKKPYGRVRMSRCSLEAR